MALILGDGLVERDIFGLNCRIPQVRYNVKLAARMTHVRIVFTDNAESLTAPRLTGETIKEFSLRALDLLNIDHDGITNPCGFYTPEIFISSKYIKDQLLDDFLKTGETLFIDQHPSQERFALMQGNLSEVQFKLTLGVCPICHEEIKPYEICITLGVCGHRLHVTCGSHLTNRKCPVCGVDIDAQDIADMAEGHAILTGR